MSWTGVAVKLHNMKAIPSTGERIAASSLGTGSSFSRRGPHAEGMRGAMTLIVALQA